MIVKVQRESEHVSFTQDHFDILVNSRVPNDRGARVFARYDNGLSPIGVFYSRLIASYIAIQNIICTKIYIS